MKKIITILLIAAASSCYSQVKPLDTIYKKIVHTYYFTSWNDTGHVANYSFYMLTKKQMKGPKLPRAFTFQIDPLNPMVSPDVYNYTFDRGHLSPFASMCFNKTAASECFYMTNIVPQNPNLNRNLWVMFEREERFQAKEFDSTYITTGCIFTSHQTFTKDSIWIPDYMYKVISNSHGTECFYARNTNQPITNINQYRVSIQFIEQKTGFTFIKN